ncbi:MAG: hypothetical protein IJB57_00530, partial [Clostridia bacterium]|nr:hypothetical protein [Clostridia bacterium]
MQQKSPQFCILHSAFCIFKKGGKFLISKEIIEEIKRRNDIVDVISSYVALKRAGSNHNGLCPFHSEKSPSFTVFDDHFYCFGCGAGGDVITFIMKVENLDYVGALEFLAKRAGITIPTEGYEPEGAEAAFGQHRRADLLRDAEMAQEDDMRRPFPLRLEDAAFDETDRLVGNDAVGAVAQVSVLRDAVIHQRIAAVAHEKRDKRGLFAVLFGIPQLLAEEARVHGGVVVALHLVVRD